MTKYEPIFLEPVFQERIWGGSKLKQTYGYELPYEKTGEAWVISAHANGPSPVKGGHFAGKTLDELWKNHGELFNKTKEDDEDYPLLVKVLDANDDLSVQVHPNDQFAREVENEPYGKTECWYVLDAKPGASIVYGHHANNQEELEEMMDHGKWDQLLERKEVERGDFYYVPSGTIHAIGEGILILEIQQSSDITYRVYDYDRTDDAGRQRELHLDQAKKVTTVPHQTPLLNQTKENIDGLINETLVEAEYFSVYHWTLKNHASLQMTEDFLQMSVIEGQATLRIQDISVNIQKGDHFILPHGVNDFELTGQAELIVSHT